MKRFFICAVFALSLCGLTAQAQEAEAPAAAAVAQPNALKEFTAVMNELTDLLRGVTDKATAEAAVPALEKLRNRMEASEGELEATLESLPEEQQMAVALSMMSTLGALSEHAERLEKNGFYGCTAFAELLAGGDDEDEDDLGDDDEDDGEGAAPEDEEE